MRLMYMGHVSILAALQVIVSISYSIRLGLLRCNINERIV